MKKSFEKLLNVAFDLKEFFKVPSYTLFQYEDGSYVEIFVRKVADLVKLLELCQGLRVQFFAGDEQILIRVYEDINDSERLGQGLVINN